MDLLERAAAWLRGALAEQPWLSDWHPAIAATPDWALLAAGPTAVALLALILRASSPKRRTPHASANSKSRRSTEPPHLCTAVTSNPTPEVPPKIQGASAEYDEDTRSVRVFVSSTFLDMQAERHELVTRVFPALRAKYRARGVEVFEVDLRWGITREQQERGETLPTLLAEIDRCRPYFIGFLGDRFGWVPPSEARSTKLKADYPAIEGAEGMSVTAMEIMHGVLANPAASARAIFFERDPNWDWISTLDEADRAAAAIETDDARAKLTELKAQIRKRAHVEPYTRPEDVRQKVFDALDQLLEARFPEKGAPDAFEQATSLHLAYARERRMLHVGAERYITALNAWASDDDAPPMLITGVSGSGKSTLVANWVHAWRKARPSDIVFEHYLGASPDSADPMLLMRRLWEYLNRATGESTPPGDNAELMDVSAALAQRLAQARLSAERSGARVLIALDGLDKLSSDQHLRWLPMPPGVHVLASSLPSEAQSAAQARRFSLIEVRPLDEREQRDFITGTLARWRRALEPEHIARILQPATAELAGSPLYLKTVLEELRVSADNARLAERLDDYRGARDMADLFDRVLTRLEGDCERGFVAEALPLIWASRAGLEETEIIAITGASPLIWAALRNGLGDGLRDGQGRIAFGHDYLSQAVAARYLKSAEQQRAVHLSIASHFEQHPSDARRAEERPFQLWSAEAWDELQTMLTDFDQFGALRSRGDHELWRWWAPLSFLDRDPESVLCQRFREYAGQPDQWDERNIDLAHSLITFLHFGHAGSEALLELARQFTSACVRHFGPQHANSIASLLSLANVYFERGSYDRARVLQEEALSKSLSLPEEPNLIALAARSNLADTLRALDELQAARCSLEQAAKAAATELGEDDDATLSIKTNLANVLHAMGDLKGALDIRQLVLEVRLNKHGREHQDTLISMNDVGINLTGLGELRDGEIVLTLAFETMKRCLGEDHPSTLRCASNLARTYYLSGDTARALALLQAVHDAWLQIRGPDFPETRDTKLGLDVMRNVSRS